MFAGSRPSSPAIVPLASVSGRSGSTRAFGLLQSLGSLDVYRSLGDPADPDTGTPAVPKPRERVAGRRRSGPYRPDPGSSRRTAALHVVARSGVRSGADVGAVFISFVLLEEEAIAKLSLSTCYGCVRPMMLRFRAWLEQLSDLQWTGPTCGGETAPTPKPPATV